MATFLDNIVVKTSFILMPTFSTTAQYRTRVTVETFDTMLVIFHRKNLKKVGKLRASWKIMSMKVTSTGLYCEFCMLTEILILDKLNLVKWIHLFFS